MITNKLQETINQIEKSDIQIGDTIIVQKLLSGKPHEGLVWSVRGKAVRLEENRLELESLDNSAGVVGVSLTSECGVFKVESTPRVTSLQIAPDLGLSDFLDHLQDWNCLNSYNSIDEYLKIKTLSVTYNGNSENENDKFIVGINGFNLNRLLRTTFKSKTNCDWVDVADASLLNVGDKIKCFLPNSSSDRDSTPTCVSGVVASPWSSTYGLGVGDPNSGRIHFRLNGPDNKFMRLEVVSSGKVFTRDSILQLPVFKNFGQCEWILEFSNVPNSKIRIKPLKAKIETAKKTLFLYADNYRSSYLTIEEFDEKIKSLTIESLAD